MTTQADSPHVVADETSGIPRAHALPGSAAPAAGCGGTVPPPSPLKVLIVDDSDLVRERLAALLGELPGVAVVGQAADGTTALRLFQARHPDVVVLDIELPGASGFLVLTWIKRHQPAAVVIMLSNHAALPFRLGCARLQAEYFFSKSTEFERVADLLRTMLPTPNATN